MSVELVAFFNNKSSKSDDFACAANEAVFMQFHMIKDLYSKLFVSQFYDPKYSRIKTEP